MRRVVRGYWGSLVANPSCPTSHSQNWGEVPPGGLLLVTCRDQCPLKTGQPGPWGRSLRDMVGSPVLERDLEIAALGRLMARAAGGRGGLLAIEGPAGIGKSRLLAHAREKATGAGWRVLDTRCTPMSTTISYCLLRDWFGMLAHRTGDGVHPFDGPARVLSRAVRRRQRSIGDLVYGVRWVLEDLTTTSRSADGRRPPLGRRRLPRGDGPVGQRAPASAVPGPVRRTHRRAGTLPRRSPASAEQPRAQPAPLSRIAVGALLRHSAPGAPGDGERSTTSPAACRSSCAS